jgi:hypothetical protein
VRRALRSLVWNIKWNGTDDMLWNGSEEEGNVRSECKKDGNSLVSAKKMETV